MIYASISCCPMNHTVLILLPLHCTLQHYQTHMQFAVAHCLELCSVIFLNLQVVKFSVSNFCCGNSLRNFGLNS